MKGLFVLAIAGIFTLVVTVKCGIRLGSHGKLLEKRSDQPCECDGGESRTP